MQQFHLLNKTLRSIFTKLTHRACNSPTYRNELFVILTYHTAKSQRGNADAFGIFSPFLPKPPAFPIPLRRTSLSVKSRQKRKNGFDAFLVSKEHKAQTPAPPNQNNGEMAKQKIGNGHGPARPRRKRKELKWWGEYEEHGSGAREAARMKATV